MGTVSSPSLEQVETAASHTRELAGAFPSEFLFGAATASYQIEGAVGEDGRGPSVWDTFSSRPGKTYNGDTGAVACDHYHRYLEDIRLMADLGLNAYRFSIAWPRIIPQGTGPVNLKGLDFYDRLVDALLEAGIQPMPTLYHWDHPQPMEDAGGWYSRATCEAFATYSRVVAERLGDRVTSWITLNEPAVCAWVGHGEGRHAPGRRDGVDGAVRSAHHLLLAHGMAVEALRQVAPRARVGITLNLSPQYPATESEEDRLAARHSDAGADRWFLDPIFRSSYPSERPDLVEHLPASWEGDLSTIAVPIDFLGVNYYSRSVVEGESSGRPRHVHPEGVDRTDAGWEIYPDGLRTVLERVGLEYRVPSVYVTENGAAYAVGPDDQGRVRDHVRTEYLYRHLAAVAEAIAAGVRVQGYFVWSLLDNFEWARGYDDATRFGIVYVDYQSQERFVKDSARWYATLISEHRSISGE